MTARNGLILPYNSFTFQTPGPEPLHCLGEIATLSLAPGHFCHDRQSPSPGAAAGANISRIRLLMQWQREREKKNTHPTFLSFVVIKFSGCMIMFPREENRCPQFGRANCSSARGQNKLPVRESHDSAVVGPQQLTNQ